MFAFCTETFSTDTAAGIPITIHEGNICLSTDPVVKAYPKFFADGPRDLIRTVAPEADAPAAKKTAKK